MISKRLTSKFPYDDRTDKNIVAPLRIQKVVLTYFKEAVVGCLWTINWQYKRRATRSLLEEVPGIWFTSWPLFFLIFLQLLLTQQLFQFYQLLYSYSTSPSSGIVAVLIAKAGHVWVNWPEEFLLYILSLTLQ